MKFSIEQILKIPTVKVLVCEEIEGLGFIVAIEKIEKYCPCPKCGKITYSIHQKHWRMVRDLPWGEKPVMLGINRRQFRCKNCPEIFSEDLEWLYRSLYGKLVVPR